MHRFPTAKVWELIHMQYPPDKYAMLARVLRLKSHPRLLGLIHNLWMWLLVICIVNGINYLSGSLLGIRIFGLIQFLSWLIPLGITVISLRYALAVSNAIGKQREQGNYDLFLLLPAGEFNSVMDIARAQRYPYDGSIGGKIVLIPLAILCGSCSFFSIAFAGTNGISTLLSIFLIPFFTATTFTQYAQTFISATLISLLVSQRQERGRAQVSVIGLFLALQILFYFIIPLLFNLLYVFIISTLISGFNLSVIYAWSVLQTLMMIGLRELVNFALWQALKRRLGT